MLVAGVCRAMAEIVAICTSGGFRVFNITDILATGAATNIVLINAGRNASLGASSTLPGTIFAGARPSSLHRQAR